MPNQVAVQAPGDCGARALPGDDSHQFVFDRNPTPMWRYDLDTHRFLGLTAGSRRPFSPLGPFEFDVDGPSLVVIEPNTVARLHIIERVVDDDSRQAKRTLDPVVAANDSTLHQSVERDDAANHFVFHGGETGRGCSQRWPHASHWRASVCCIRLVYSNHRVLMAKHFGQPGRGGAIWETNPIAPPGRWSIRVIPNVIGGPMPVDEDEAPATHAHRK
jgi:hypothetical protein